MITCQQRLAQATIELIDCQDLCCDRPKAKKLAGKLCKHREKPWRILSNNKHGQHIFVSAEEFSVLLTNQNALKNLVKIANIYGFNLHIAIFIFSQVDHATMRYIFSLRKLYCSQIIEEFVTYSLKAVTRNYCWPWRSQELLTH